MRSYGRSTKRLARTTGNVAVARGDAQAIERIAAASRIVAEYEFPISRTRRWSR